MFSTSRSESRATMASYGERRKRRNLCQQTLPNSGRLGLNCGGDGARPRLTGNAPSARTWRSSLLGSGPQPGVAINTSNTVPPYEDPAWLRMALLLLLLLLLPDVIDDDDDDEEEEEEEEEGEEEEEEKKERGRSR